MEFINSVTIQGVVVEPPFISGTKRGRNVSVIAWTRYNTNEYVFKVMTPTIWLQTIMMELSRGSICGFTGNLIITKKIDPSIQPSMPIISLLSIAPLDVSLHYGIELLENSNMKDIFNDEKFKLPWD